MLSIFVLILIGAGLMLWPNVPWLAVFMFLIGGGVGFIGFTIFVSRVQALFLRPENRVLIQRQSIFGRSASEHDLSHLIRAEVEEHHSGTGDRPRILYRPNLILKCNGDEERIPVVETYSNEAGVHTLVDAIDDWLPAAKLDSDT